MKNTEEQKAENLANMLRTVFLVALVALIGVYIISHNIDNLAPDSDATLQATSSKL